MAGLTDTLELDISQALAAIDTIGTTLTQTTTTFGVQLAEALDVLRAPVPVAVDPSDIAPVVEAALTDAASKPITVEADAAAVTTDVDDALGASDKTVPVDADASAVTTDVDAALGAADSTVPVQADASAVTTEVDDAIKAADATVPVQADASEVGSEIETAVAGSDVTVTPTADTDGMVTEIQDAGDSADVVVPVSADTTEAQQEIDNLGESAGGAEGKVEGLSGAMGGLKVAAGAAVGEGVGELPELLGKIGPEGEIAAAGIGVLVGTTGVFVNKALEGQQAADTFRITVGDMGAVVEHIDVGGLNTSLDDLATKLGSSRVGAENAASRIYELGTSSGTAAPQVAETTKQIEALAARAVALNPNLGDVGTTAESMTNSLARGGRSLAAYGLNITSTDIVARALADTHKDSAAQLTVYDRAAAGAAIATEKLGDSISTAVNERAGTAVTTFGRLRQEFDNVIEDAGKPMLKPLADSLETLEPAMEDVAKSTGAMLAAVIPLAQEVASELAPELKGTAEGLGYVAAGLNGVLGPLNDLSDAIPGVTGGFGGLLGIVSEAVNPLAQIGHIASSAADLWHDAFGGGGKAADEFTDSVTKAKQALEDNAKQTLINSQASGEFTDQEVKYAIAANTSKNGTVNYQKALGDLKASHEAAQAATQHEADTIESLGGKAEKSADEIELLKQATDSLFGIVVGVDEATVNYHRALDTLDEKAKAVYAAQQNLNAAIKDAGPHSIEAAEATKDLQTKQDDLTDASVKALTAGKDLTTAIDTQAQTMRAGSPATAALRQELVDLQNRYPQLRGETQKYIDQIDHLPVPDFHGQQASDQFLAAVDPVAEHARQILRTAGEQGGADFAKGIGIGVVAHYPDLNATGLNAAGVVIQAARNAMKSSSPSKVAMEIGGDFVAGMVLGLQQTDPLEGAVDRMHAVITRPLPGASSPGMAGPSSLAGLAAAPLVNIEHADLSRPEEADAVAQRISFAMTVPR